MNHRYQETLEHLESGNYIQALEYLEPLAKQQPESLEIQFAYARALYLAWRYAEAEDILKRLISKQFSPEAGHTLINLYLDTLRFSDAEETARSLLNVFPCSLTTQKLLSDSLWRQRRYQESKGVLQDTVRLSPENSNEWYLLANTQLRLNHIWEAIRSFIEALRLNPDFQLATEGLQHTLSVPDFRSECLSQLEAHAQLETDYCYWFGKALRYSNRLEDAISAFRTVLGSRPDYQQVELELASTLDDAGYSVEASAILTEHSRTQSGSDPHWALLGRQALRAGNHELASDRFFQAIWMSDGIESYGQLRILVNDSNAQRVIRHAEQKMDQHRTPESIGQIAQIHRLRCDYSLALMYLEQLLALMPDHRWRSQYDTIRRNLHLGHFRRIILPFFAPKNLNDFRTRVRSKNRLKFLSNPLESLGSASKTFGFKGPSRVEIKLGNPCNNDCIGCCYRSPLLIEARQHEEWYSQSIHPIVARQTIQQLIEEGVREIRFSGGGEPLMYPGFMDLVKTVISNGIKVIIITNGTLLSKDIIETLFFSPNDVTLVVSLWAANGDTYAKLHPNKTPEDFDRIIDLLKHYRVLKSTHPQTKMLLVHTHVLNQINYLETIPMFELGADLGVASIHYTMMLPLNYQTDQLLCGVDELDHLGKDLNIVIRKADKARIHLFNIHQLMQQISRDNSVFGLFDAVTGSDVPCTIGWSFAMINADGEVHPCVESQRLNLGNLKKDSFKEIWNSNPYLDFRVKISTTPDFRQEPYFSRIECWKKCDHHDDENTSAYRYISGKLRIIRRWRSMFLQNLLRFDRLLYKTRKQALSNEQNLPESSPPHSSDQ